MKLIEDTMILRFASGEMAAKEESDFLAQCEIAPDSWRSATLAIAEHRRMVEALGEMACAETNPLATGTVKPAIVFRRSRPALAAAALLIGLLLGIMGMRVNGFVNNRKMPAAATTPPAAQLPETLVAAKPDSAFPVPTDAATNMPTMPEAQPAAPVTHDVEVKEEPTLFIVTTKDGTRWAIPIQQTTFCYVSR